MEMAYLNCWEFNKCGREPKGKNAHHLGICPASVFDDSDGFCHGKNGGRACMYIAGTFCSDSIPGTLTESMKNCDNCDFYRLVKMEHRNDMSAFAFQRYVNERKTDFLMITEHEVCKVTPIFRREDLAKKDTPFEEDNIDKIWMRLLNLVDYCNHAVKHGEWYEEDLKRFYKLKDLLMEKLYHNPPDGATVRLKKVMKPYKNDFSSEWEQHSHENNVKGMILIEMEITYAGKIFCLHIPVEKAKDWGLNIQSLSSKEWVPSGEFNREFFKDVFEGISVLLDQI